VIVVQRIYVDDVMEIEEFGKLVWKKVINKKIIHNIFSPTVHTFVLIVCEDQLLDLLFVSASYRSNNIHDIYYNHPASLDIDICDVEEWRSIILWECGSS